MGDFLSNPSNYNILGYHWEYFLIFQMNLSLEWSIQNLAKNMMSLTKRKLNLNVLLFFYLKLNRTFVLNNFK